MQHLFIAVIFLFLSSCVHHQRETARLDQVNFYWLLNRACTFGDDLGVRMLLNAGADVDGTEDYAKFAAAGYGIEPSWPINQACWGGHADIVKILLERGAKVDSPEGPGYTALLIATGEGHAEVVEILLKAGADRSYRGQPGTALEVARAKKLNEIIKLLTEKPAATGGSR
jgi:ankyrin repeat protein